MRNKSYLFILLFTAFTLLSFNSYSQTGKDKKDLYGEEIQNQIDLYEDLIDKNFLQEYYDNLIGLYSQTNQDSKAEKLIKKTIKQFPQNSIYVADLGTHYLRQGDKSKADKQFDKAIDNLQEIGRASCRERV